jgi:hypothetical protein
LRGPTQISLGKNTGCPAAPAPITAPASVGFWALRLETRSPGRSGLHRGSLAFGAAVRLGLLLHTASRRQLWRLTTAVTACSCLQLAVATNSPRKGLSPPIQCPCQAHLRCGAAVNCGGSINGAIGEHRRRDGAVLAEGDRSLACQPDPGLGPVIDPALIVLSPVARKRPIRAFECWI